MAISRLLLLLAPALLAGQALAHGGAHSQAPEVDADADWATRHLAGKAPSPSISKPLYLF
jgi:hypothetical protein